MKLPKVRGVYMPVVRIDASTIRALQIIGACPTENYCAAGTASSPKGGWSWAGSSRAGIVVESLLVNEASFRALETRCRALPQDVPVYVCDTDEFAAITGFNLHRGCLALAERPTDRALDDVCAGADLLLVLEGVTDPDNVGSAFRNAAAFGASVAAEPDLLRSAVPQGDPNVDGQRAAHTVRALNDWPGDLAALKREGFTHRRADAARGRGRSRSVRAEPAPGSESALLVGSEGPG